MKRKSLPGDGKGCGEPVAEKDKAIMTSRVSTDNFIWLYTHLSDVSRSSSSSFHSYIQPICTGQWNPSSSPFFPSRSTQRIELVTSGGSFRRHFTLSAAEVLLVTIVTPSDRCEMPRTNASPCVSGWQLLDGSSQRKWKILHFSCWWK